MYDSSLNIEMNQARASMDLLSEIIGEWAIGHGFREDWELADKLDQLAQRLHNEDVEANQEDYIMLWQAAEALRTNVLGMKLMLSVSELAEALDTLRKVGASGVLRGEGNFSEELADTHIRLFDLAHLINPKLKIGSVAQEVIDKIKVNAKRPYKHGKKC
jgi:hypothetical protein